MRKTITTITMFLLVPCLAAAQSMPAAGGADLARSRGCYLCHLGNSEPPRTDGRLPRAPAWEDIAGQYAGQPNADDRLARIVVRGTGRRLEDMHWRGRVEYSAMPPNDYHVSIEEAREIVRWILSDKP